MELHPYARFVMIMTVIGIITTISLLVNAICVSIFGYSDLIYMANNWRVAVGMIIVLIGVGVITDALTKNAIKEICEEAF